MAGVRGGTIGVPSSNIDTKVTSVTITADQLGSLGEEKTLCYDDATLHSDTHLPSRPSFPAPYTHTLLIPLLKDHILQEDPT